MPLTADQQDMAVDYVGLARGQAWAYFRRSSGADVDSVMSSALHGILGGFMAAFDRLDAEVRVVLAFRYFREMDFKDIAERLRTSPERVAELHDAGVKAIHQALLLAVSAA